MLLEYPQLFSYSFFLLTYGKMGFEELLEIIIDYQLKAK